MDSWVLLLIVARLIVLALGAITTAISYRAYRQTGSDYLVDATIAFGLITFGVLIEGGLYEFTNLSLAQVHIVESVTIGLGFLVLIRSFVR